MRALLLFSVVVLSAILAAPATALGGPSVRTLKVVVQGLPAGQAPAVTVRGPGLARSVRGRRTTVRLRRAGRYTVVARRVTIDRRWRSVSPGARAYPTRKRIVVRSRARRPRSVRVSYGTIVNPRVTTLPNGLVDVVGDEVNPTALVYGPSGRLPGPGTIISSAATAQLPRGLLGRVVARTRTGSVRVLEITPVPVTEAFPAFDYSGPLELRPAANASRTARGTTTRARASADSCNGPRQFDVSTTLDEFEIRRATAHVWPPQMSFQVAVRTTERLGTKIAVAGLSCSWQLGALGPWHGAIPTPVGAIPVYATIPARATASVEGSLSAFRLNLASTSVMDLELGDRNSFGFWQEGSNVWVDGVLQFSGSAAVGVSLNLELGVGSPGLADVHLNAGFGATATWRSGSGCDVDVDLGSLSAGVRFRGFEKGTPAWSPFRRNLWHGCDGTGSAPPQDQTGGGQDGSQGAGPAPVSQPAPSPTPQPQPQPGACHGGGGTSAGGPGRAGFHIQDIHYGGTWARTDPCNGTWHSASTRPANGAYWYSNGLGVGVDCARTGAAYTVRWRDGRVETWDTWFHVTDGKWFPSAAAQQTTQNGFYGLPAC